MRLRFWDVRNEEPLRYLVDEDIAGDVVPDECHGAVSELLSDIFEGHAVDPQLGSEKARLLETSEDICLLTQGEEGKAQLTSKGQECVRVCCRLINPRQVAASRTLPISELTVGELLVLLGKDNFKHGDKPPSRKDCPFDPHDRGKPRVWYSRLGSDTAPR